MLSSLLMLVIWGYPMKNLSFTENEKYIFAHYFFVCISKRGKKLKKNDFGKLPKITKNAQCAIDACNLEDCTLILLLLISSIGVAKKKIMITYP